MHGRLTRLAVAAISIIALSPTIASAQWWTGRSSSDSTDTCGQSGCAWLMFVNEFPFGMLSLSHGHRSSALSGSAALVGFNDDLFSFSGNSFSSLSDCPACTSNDRPFVVPPGIEEKLAHPQGVQTGDDASDGDHAAEIGDAEDGPPVETPGAHGEGGATGVGLGPTAAHGDNAGGVGQNPPGGFVAGAVAPAVVVTPEPGAFVLLATGLLALAPIVVRSRRRNR